MIPTLAAARGSPLSPVTLPLTRRVCASALVSGNADSSRASRDQRTFFTPFSSVELGGCGWTQSDRYEHRGEVKPPDGAPNDLLSRPGTQKCQAFRARFIIGRR